jgi:outer membrane protein assembly factor BamB
VATPEQDLAIFCPTCDRLILDEKSCDRCGWHRPLLSVGPGTLLWQVSLPGRLSEPFTLLAVSGDLLLLGLELGVRSDILQGAVLALDIASGRERWRHNLPGGRLAQPPVVAGEYILIGSQDVTPLPNPQNALTALDRTGALAWQYSVEAHSLSAPAVLGDRLFITTSSDAGYILTLPHGRLQQSVNYLPSWTPAGPTVGGDTYYVGSKQRVIAAVTAADGHASTLFRLNREGSWFTLPLAFKHGLVYAVCTDKRLYAIDGCTGHLRWRIPLARGASSPPVAGEYLYVGVKEKAKTNELSYALYALDLASGELVWRFEADKHIEAPVLVMEDFVFAGSKGGRFYCLDAYSGAVCWQLDLEDRIMSAPVSAGDNLILGTREGRIVAVVWQQSTNRHELLAADTYRAKADWQRAGISAALAGDWLAAAADFERANEPGHAAQLYERAGAWQQAGNTYRQAYEPHLAIAAYRIAGDKAGEAAVLLDLNDYADAATVYENAGFYAEAAAAYIEAGLVGHAARCYAQADQLQHAAELYLALDEPLTAANLYQQLGDSDRAVLILRQANLAGAAAQVLVNNGRFAEAADLLEEAQLIHEAAAVWQEQANWEVAAQVYERNQQWSRAAEMYVQANEFQEAARLYQQDNQLSHGASPC